MLFQKYSDWLNPTRENGVLGGSSLYQISREYPIEMMMLVVSVTVSTAAATLNADGLLQIIKKIQLKCLDNGITRTPIDISGPALVEMAYHMGPGYVDRNTRTRLNGAAAPAATYEIVIPIFAMHPQVPSPFAEMLLLPVDRYAANPELSIQFATQADMDLNAAKTFAISALSTTLVVHRRVVDRAKWPIIDWDLIEQYVPLANSGDNQFFDIPLTGQYTGILLRSYTGTAAAQTRGDISQAGADFDIRLNQAVMRRFRLLDIQRENDYSASVGSGATDSLNGSYFLDFLYDRAGSGGGMDTKACFGSLLNANLPLQSGVALRIRQNVTGNTGAGIQYVMHKLYGNLSDFKY